MMTFNSLIACCVLGLSVACCGPGGGTYCQSGPRYGTQCYSRQDLAPPGSPPVNPDPNDPRR
jgi:hypothetical protein